MMRIEPSHGTYMPPPLPCITQATRRGGRTVLQGMECMSAPLGRAGARARLGHGVLRRGTMSAADTA